MRSIVYNDISKSPFCYEVDDMIFYFSSEFNKRRFIDGYQEYVEDETYKLENRYNIKFYLKRDLTVAFYKKIEKRGYKVTNKDNEILTLT